MKKLFILGLAIVFGSVVAVQGVQASTSYFTREQTSIATTSTQYMRPGIATTTLTYASNDVDKADLFLQFTASTSAAVLGWNYQFSNNGVDWFGEDSIATVVALNQTFFDHATSSPTHRLLPGSTTASTTNRVLTIPNIASNFTRVNFFLPIGGVNGSIWAVITAKRQGAN